MAGLIYFLALLSICQFLIICFLIYERNHHQTITTQEHKLERRLIIPASVSAITPTSTPMITITTTATNTTSLSSSSLSSCQQEIEGVAVTVFMGSPKWFQNRYSIMINQVLSSIGPTWKVQIFYRVFGTQMGIAATTYAGIQHKIRRGQVILTPIPSLFKGIKKKDFMIQPWFWKHMLHDRVLLFGGSTVLCANSPYQIDDFLDYDLLGGPWGLQHGMGGDGALSIRNRTLMIQALESEILLPLSTPIDKQGSGSLTAAASAAVSPSTIIIRKATPEYAKKREEMAFIDALRSLEKQQSLSGVRIASREDTHRFVSSEGWWKGSSLGNNTHEHYQQTKTNNN